MRVGRSYISLCCNKRCVLLPYDAVLPYMLFHEIGLALIAMPLFNGPSREGTEHTARRYLLTMCYEQLHIVRPG